MKGILSSNICILVETSSENTTDLGHKERQTERNVCILWDGSKSKSEGCHLRNVPWVGES